MAELVTFNPDAISFASFRMELMWQDSGVLRGTIRVQVRAVVPRAMNSKDSDPGRVWGRPGSRQAVRQVWLIRAY